MKPVLMIHELTDWMFDLPLHNFILTFDDGLYTQYIHLDKINKIDTDKIFFISTGIVATEQTKQSDEFIKCQAAHDKLFRRGDRTHYMNWSQIKEISREPRCEIGAHGHMHLKHTRLKTIHDTKLMMKHFEKNNLAPTKFCFPYNNENIIYRCLLKQYGFTKFYGKDRINIYDL